MSLRPWTLVAVALVLVACSSDDAGSSTSTSAPAAESSTASATSGGATTSAPAVTEPVITAPATSAAPASAPAGGVAPVGFSQSAARVTAADGETCDVCLWLADTPELRARGLMGVTDLSGADGMAFTWDEPVSGAFWMRDTPSPLSIAFFAADGSFVSSADMEPCLQPTPDAECARYPAAAPYQYAVEVAAGGLPALLMAPGSRFELVPGTCPRAG